MSKIRQLFDMPIYGNALEDAPLFQLASEIVLDSDTTMNQKKAAIRRIDEAMGTKGAVTDESVREYIAFVSE